VNGFATEVMLVELVPFAMVDNPIGKLSASRKINKEGVSLIFKVAFSTFWFKFGATLRRQAERRYSGTKQKASNLARPIS